MSMEQDKTGAEGGGPAGGAPPPSPPEKPAAPAKAEPPRAPRLVVSTSPHVHRDEDVPRIMRSVVYALVPGILVGLWFFGLVALQVYAIAVAGCMLLEWAFQRMLGRPNTLGDWSAVVTGLLLAMNLPAGSPWWMVVVGCLAAVVLGKGIYGGLGYNPFNPALVARVVLLISFPVQMTTWPAQGGPLTVDATTAATPLGAIREALSLGQTVPQAMAGMDVPLWKLLVGMRSGCLGEVSVVALLLGGLFLLRKGHIKWQVPLGFIATVFLFTGVAWLADPAHYANPLYHTFSGGLFLGAFFMATDMVTSPVTRKGMFIFAVGCGLITVIIRLWGGYPEGVSFAILLMNAATPLIDRYTKPRVFGAKRKLYEEAKAA